MRGLACSLVLVFAVCVVACGGGKTPTSGPGAPEASKKVYLRDEFRQLLVGKTPDEVIKAVGKPARTQDSGGGSNWYFEGVSTDPVTGKVDSSVQVVFEGGRVVRVNF